MADTPQNNPVIREILRQGRKLPKNVRNRYVAAALETGRIESGFKNVGYGDADSVNWRQERASIYGGDMSIRRSVGRFFKEAAQHDRGQASFELAADVQRPAAQYRGRYRTAQTEALGLLSGYAGGASPAGPTAPAPAAQVTQTTTTPGVNNAPLRRQAVAQFLQQGGVRNPNAVMNLAGTYGSLADTPGQTSPSTPPSARAAQPTQQRLKSGVVPLGGSKNAGKGAFDISGPNPGRLKPELRSFARKVAEVYGGPLVGLDGSTHSRLTVNGNVSEHYTGNATDIFTIGGKPAQGKTLLRAGRAALIAAGMPRAQALKAQGGLYNVGSHQIIFLTNEGGNHFDHLHISTHAK